MAVKNTFYAIVVGAGPAGSSAATVLCEQSGLDVALVDRKSFPRDKSCGDGLGPGVVNCLHRLGLEQELARFSAIKTVCVHGPSGVEAAGYLPRIDGKGAIGYVIPRKRFDNILFVHALRSGAADYSDHSCSSLDFDRKAKMWTVTLKRNSDGARVTLRAKILIGADGATSKVRRHLGAPLNSAQTTGVGIRSYSQMQSASDELRLDFIKPLLPAYGWAFPLAAGRANFGIGIDAHRLQLAGTSLAELLEGYRIWAVRCLGTPVELSDHLSAPLPYAAPLCRLAFEDQSAALIGDAASMVNPLTGEGIFYGMFAGISCAEAVHQAYGQQVTLSTALNNYQQLFYQRFAHHFLSNWKMKQMMVSRFWCNMVVAACAKKPAIMDDLVSVTMGDKARLSVMTGLQIVLQGLWR